LGRKVRFTDNAFILELTGMTRFFALKKRMVIPYHMIERAIVDYFQAPFWLVKLPGTAIPWLNIYEGTFFYKGYWYFLSYERKVPLVILELKGHPRYNFVIFETADPTTTVAELNKRLIK